MMAGPEDFKEALKIWHEEECSTERSTNFKSLHSHWNGGQATILSYPRALALDGQVLSAELIKLLKESLNGENSLLQNGRVREILGITEVEVQSQVVNLASGILNGILASQVLAGWTSNRNHADFTEAWDAIENCFECYHAAWDFKSPKIDDTELKQQPVEAEMLSHAKPDPDKATAILDQFREVKRPTAEIWWTESNWLLVRRLLSYLLGEQGDSFLQKNTVQMLLVSKEDIDGNYKGETAPVTTTAVQERWSSAYLDPVSLGITILDKKMLTSLELAGRVCQPVLSENHQSLRISPDIGRLDYYIQLAGGSAGGIVTLSSCATALGIRLNQTATASFQIQESQEEDESDKELTIDDLTFEPVGEDSLAAKLQRDVLGSAVTETGEPLNTVYLHHNQKCCLNGQAPLEWDEWTKMVSNQQQLTIMPIKEKTSLRTLIHQMSGDERIEHQFEKYCDTVIQEWEQLTRPGLDEAELEHYISPWFSRAINPNSTKLEDSSENQDLKNLYRPLCNPTDSESTKFLSLFQMGDASQPSSLKSRRIVLTEDAGAGKSVFSRAIKRWLCSQEGRDALYEGQPPLVIRWERGKHSWPEKTDANTSGRNVYIQHLTEEIQSALDITEETKAASIVEYAMRKGRVVFILDSFDQLAGNTKARQIEAFEELVETSKFHDFRIIVTSRAKPVEDLRSEEGLFSWQTWNFVRINGFTPFQQLVYLKDLTESLVGFADEQTRQAWDDFFEPFNSQGESIGESRNLNQGDDQDEPDPDQVARAYLRQIFKDVYDEVQELLEVPAVLKFIRFLSRSQNRFPEFANRADLYFQATDHIFERNLTKHDQFKSNVPNYKKYFREILSAAAYQMMILDSHTYNVENDLVTKLEELTKTCITNSAITKNWDLLWENMQVVAGLTNHLILEDKSKDYFGFKHKGMMEFYAGLFLSRNSHGDWDNISQAGQELEGASTLIEKSADSNWDWAYRFAVELLESRKTSARQYPTNESLLPSLKALFAPKQETHHLRPTKLMFRVWKILKRNENSNSEIKKCLDDLLDFYRSSFRGIFIERDEQGEPAGRAFLAAELVHEDDLPELVTKAIEEREGNLRVQLGQLEGKNRTERQDERTIETELNWLREFDKDSVINGWVTKITPHHQSYSRCADSIHDKQTGSDDYLTFMMGASPEDDEAYGENEEDYENEKPWQMVRVKAFDMAVCSVTRAQYCLFDAQLEQHYESDFSQISPEPDCPVIKTNWFDGVMLSLWLGDRYRLPSEFEWEGAAWGGLDRWEPENMKLKYSVLYHESITINEVNFDGKLGRTLPVRWDQERYETSQDAELKKIVRNHYLPNGFGLYHLNGNVSEWSSTVWNTELLDERILEIFCYNLNRARVEISIAEALQWLEQESGLDTKQAWLALWEEMEPLEAPTSVSVHADCYHCLRGGSWIILARISRTSSRYGNGLEPDYRLNDLGLRILRTK
ncbi:SUMF1/EgtB/PvdO family nonheme iron enzyme [Gimesia sp.]|uniref:SUMF1/EgtB/PvdO family nonheme iron enzyme n=1 Tax=Gimesia sp. TaxID=2024833 RepID=UPI003A90A2E4